MHALLSHAVWNFVDTKHYINSKTFNLPSQQQIPVCLLVQTDEVEQTVVIEAKIERKLCFIIFKV